MWYIKASSSLRAIWFDKIKEAMQIIEFFKKIFILFIFGGIGSQVRCVASLVAGVGLSCIWDLSSPIRDQTPTRRTGRQTPNHWTNRGVRILEFFLRNENILCF